MGAKVPQCGIERIKQFEDSQMKLADSRAEAYADPAKGWALPNSEG